MKKLSSALLMLTAACGQHPKVGGAVQPTTFIDTKSVTKVTNKLTELCSRKGLMIDETTNNSVICSASANSIAQMLMTTKGGTEVRSRVRMTVFPVNNQIKVVANAWYESQNFYGKTDRNNAGDANSNAEVQSMLDEAKVELDGKVRR